MTSTHPKQPVWWARTRTGPLVLALTAALILTATPAVAKKGGPPDPPKVTVEFDGALATTCPMGPLTMVMESWKGGGTSLLADAYAGHPADLDLDAVFGEESFAPGVCDYGTRLDSPVDDFGTLLWIAFDGAGNLAEFVWHFDAYVDEPRTHRGKRKGSPIVRERFTLALDDPETRMFKLSRYTNDEPDGGPGPTWTLIGSQNLTFEISYS